MLESLPVGGRRQARRFCLGLSKENRHHVELVHAIDDEAEDQQPEPGAKATRFQGYLVGKASYRQYLRALCLALSHAIRLFQMQYSLNLSRYRRRRYRIKQI